MADTGPQLSRRPGAHLKNAIVYQRDIDRFTPIVQGLLNPYSLPPRPGNTVSLDPIAYHGGAAMASTRSAMNPRQNPYKNLPGAAGGFAIGGMLTHWTSSIPRHHPSLEMMPCISKPEWGKLYETAERFLNKNTNIFSGSVRQKAIKKVLRDHFSGKIEDAYLPQELPMAGERKKDNPEFINYSGADTILGPLIDEDGNYNQKNLTVLPEHRVRELVRSGDKIEYAIVDDLQNGNAMRVFADTFIVAAGSIMTPQLLWNSKIRPPALGRYLTEHTFTFTQVVLKQEIVESMASDQEFKERLSRNDSTDPIPIPMKDPPPQLCIPVSAGRPWHCQVHRDSFQFGGIAPDIDSRLVVDLRWFGMVEPNSENRVKFESDIFDKFGMPQPTFEYSLSQADKKRAHEMMEDMTHVANVLGGFLVGSEPRFMPPGSSLHLMGTTRMGDKTDGTSVVDTHSRVWEIDNLFLGGNGLLSEMNAANPTLTSVALAVKAANKICGKS